MALDLDAVALPDLLRRRVHEEPDRTFALFADSPAWTFADTATRAWGLGRGLATLGVEPGETVVSLLPNGPEQLATWFGTNAAGAIHAPVNVAQRGRVLEHIVNVTRARVLVAHAALIDRLRDLTLPHLERVVVAGSAAAGTPADLGRTTLVPWDDVAAPADAPLDGRGRRPWDDMAVIFSSGTTGVSKGVRCSYIHHFVHQDATLPPSLGRDERYLVTLPMFHVGATGTIYGALARSASVAIIESFRTRQFWADVTRFEATVAWILGAMAAFLMAEPVSDADSANPLRLALMVPVIADVDAFARRFEVEVMTCYGSTEVPPPFRTLLPAPPMSCGRVWSDDFDVRLVDEHDIEVPDGEPGELIVRHQQPWALASGYVDMPEATAAAWRNGWFHTGDRFRRGPDGSYFFLDRVKDSIRRRGEFVSSLEVEREILTHPAIRETAVVGVPSDDGTGDEVMAFVVVEEGADLSMPELVDHLATRMAHFMVPRYVEVVGQLPRTETAKLKKEDLRRRGISASTWDRVAAGIDLRAERLTGRAS